MRDNLLRVAAAHVTVLPSGHDFFVDGPDTLLEAALRAGHQVTQAAALAGFNSDTQLRRAWHQFGRSGTPSQSGRQAH